MLTGNCIGRLFFMTVINDHIYTIIVYCTFQKKTFDCCIHLCTLHVNLLTTNNDVFVFPDIQLIPLTV